jgi:5'-3' exonuclease
MGVPGFFAWLLRNKKKLGTKKLITENIITKCKYLMLDTNCLLHPCVNNVLTKYKEGVLYLDESKELRPQLEEKIWELIENYINDMIEKVRPEILYVAIDGVAPIGKILQQRQRRYRYLFDRTIKIGNSSQSEIKFNKKANDILEPEIPISSIELTPGTDYMERIHKSMEKYMNKLASRGIKYIYSSYHEEGEGEHKLLQYIKKNVSADDGVIIYGLDADLLFLSLGIGINHNVFIMREKQVFDNKEVDLDDYPDYNYVEIKELHKLIGNLEISTPDFIVLCYLIGNDFLPSILTLDVKKGGIDKIIRAFQNVITNFNIKLVDANGIITDKLVLLTEKGDYDLNHDFMFELMKELAWTEKHIWKNINRDVILNQRELDQEELELKLAEKAEEKRNTMLKFVLGLSDSTNGLEKIEFGSDHEYYSYYLGLDGSTRLDIDRAIISKLVKDYITGIVWCINYYLDECKSWTLGYNFMVGPLIQDIIKYYPKKVSYKKTSRSLNPVEQLILAIPPETYSYVIESDIIKRLQSDKKIGYMFPQSYCLDVNKEAKLWKCQVKIPMVEYDEFVRGIKSINISNDKNKIIPSISNI